MSRLPKYRLHKGSGQAVVTLAGRDHYLGAHGTAASKRQYARLIAEFSAADGNSSFGTSPTEVTVATVMADYIRFADKHYPATRTSEARQIRLILRVVKKLYADLPAAKFGPQQFKAVRQKLLDDPVCQRSKKSTKKSRSPLSRGYINAQMARVLRMFRWAASDGIIPAETYLGLKIIPGLQVGRSSAPEAPEVQPVSDALVEQTLLHCTPVVADMIRIQRLTGMRPGEVCKLTPAMIHREGQVWLAKLPDHKGAWRGKDRLVYIGPKAQAILEKYLTRADSANCFSPAESEEQRRAAISAQRATPLSQGNRRGYSKRSRAGTTPACQPSTSYDTASYGRAIKYACVKGGLTHWAPNQLRHAAGTEIRRMFGLDHTAAALGHSEVTVTQVYAELDQAKAIEVALKLG